MMSFWKFILVQDAQNLKYWGFWGI
jgi:hypothetical protein